MQRARHNMDVISNVTYHGDRERRTQMEMARPAEQVEGKLIEIEKKIDQKGSLDVSKLMGTLVTLI